MTITCSFTGNLGNHMFQYAVTRAVAEHNGYEWGFNPSPEFDYFRGAPQMYFMDIDYGKVHNCKYNDTPPWILHEWKEMFGIMKFASGDIIDYHPYQSEVFDIKDNTKLYIRCCQDARYLNYEKENVRKWFIIKEDFREAYEDILISSSIVLDNNLAIINVRGGEYKQIPDVLLEKAYWWRAINFMLTNRAMKFIVITDDVEYAKGIMPPNMNIPVYHFGIGMDYYILSRAKNLILSNSSFAIFPTWLNEYNPYVIAPRYWARHNVSTGYWASSDIWTFGWNFLDRETGKLYDK